MYARTDSQVAWASVSLQAAPCMHGRLSTSTAQATCACKELPHLPRLLVAHGMHAFRTDDTLLHVTGAVTG